jgi:methyl-accepting chemotaxis protein
VRGGMMNDYRNRRRNYYIKKEFQRNFILKFCVLVLIGSAISGAILYWVSRATVTTSFENLRLVIKSTADYILPAVFFSSLIVIAIIGTATVFITLFTSHKIAGPLYRMEKDVREVALGNLSQEFSLRIGDEVRPIAQALSEMVHFLRKEVNALKKDISDLEALSVETNASQAIREKIKTLKAEIEKLKT